MVKVRVKVMSSFVSRLVACLVLVVAILQLVHLVLLNQLETRRLNQLTQIQNQFHPLALENKEEKPSSYRTRRIINRMDFHENEVLKGRLFSEDENTIVDSTGEYRVVFDIAGPSRDSATQKNTRSPYSSQIQVAQQQQQQPNANNKVTNNNDDFSIDEDGTDQEPPPSEDVTLVTHGDLQTAKRYLVPLVERWNGPVSIVIFASNSSLIEATVDFIALVRICSDVVKQYVNFHIVSPLIETHFKRRKWNSGNKTHNNNNNKNGGRTSSGGTSTTTRNTNKKVVSHPLLIDLETECQPFHPRPRTSTSGESQSDPFSLGESGGFSISSAVMMGGGGASQYPTNLLRNVGRKRTLTDHSFVVPMYMLPSEGLRPRFHRLIRRKQHDLMEEKIVYVIPSFETKSVDEVPRNKKELMNLVQNYQARPYHFELCWKCQVQTDYESWGRETGKEDELSVMYEVLWKDPWEPFFISPNSVPPFDEGFRHLNYDRLSQLCELHVAGYKFAVLTEPFLVHPGYITPTPFHLKLRGGNANANTNLDNNKLRFRQFKHELKNRYPHSTRKCY